MTAREIRKEVMRRYPRTEKERQGCQLEITRMTGLRNEYAKRLNGQTGNSETERDTSEEV